MTVTSPDSTGSDSGAGGYVQQHAYPSYGTQIAEVDMATATDNAALGSCMFHNTFISIPFLHSRSRSFWRFVFSDTFFLFPILTTHLIRS